MHYTTRQLFLLIILISSGITIYQVAYRQGQRDALRDKGVTITSHEIQLSFDDGFFISVAREPTWDSALDNAAKHSRHIYWHDADETNGKAAGQIYHTSGPIYHGSLEYYPALESFLGPEKQLPLLKWKLGISKDRPTPPAEIVIEDEAITTDDFE